MRSQVSKLITKIELTFICFMLISGFSCVISIFSGKEGQDKSIILKKDKESLDE